MDDRNFFRYQWYFHEGTINTKTALNWLELVLKTGRGRLIKPDTLPINARLSLVKSDPQMADRGSALRLDCKGGHLIGFRKIMKDSIL